MVQNGIQDFVFKLIQSSEIYYEKPNFLRMLGQLKDW